MNPNPPRKDLAPLATDRPLVHKRVKMSSLRSFVFLWLLQVTRSIVYDLFMNVNRVIEKYF